MEDFESVEIFNSQGRLVKKYFDSAARLSIEESGLYFVKVLTDEGSQTTKKIIIQ